MIFYATMRVGTWYIKYMTFTSSICRLRCRGPRCSLYYIVLYNIILFTSQLRKTLTRNRRAGWGFTSYCIIYYTILCVHCTVNAICKDNPCCRIGTWGAYYMRVLKIILRKILIFSPLRGKTMNYIMMVPHNLFFVFLCLNKI